MAGAGGSRDPEEDPKRLKRGILMPWIKKSCVLLVMFGVQLAFAQAQPATRRPDVIFVPTPHPVVEQMLKLAKVGPNDVVYDLGCGDGRLVVAAVKQFGASRAVGIDIDPERIEESTRNVKEAGVADRVTIRQEDLFEADIHDASVVTLYLLHSLNMKLRPKLWKDLKPGTRIVSQTFDMGDWKPDQEIEVEGRRVFLWTVPKTPPSGQ
jgi:precorrin-6B methylase 2